ncbi:MAG: DUF2953 domain-containing protein [Candidatus Methanoperedens sp.]|nr:DUF2953 domain-containing protein [Candidatus Methanoperedens sp.]CAG1003888.1 hypothetical protein METP1_03108 [Methanosarcinales archaeon]
MIGAIIIILSVIAVAMLLSPVTISVNSARAGGKIDGFLSLGWIMFLFRYKVKDKKTEILVLGRRVGLTHKQKSIKGNKSRKMPRLEDIFYLSRPILRLFKDLIYSVKIKYLDIDITFGSKDPACTGIVTGFLHSIIFSLRAANTIRWTADFTRPVMEWDMKAEAAITPIQILLHMARFITNHQVLRYGLGIIRDL